MNQTCKVCGEPAAGFHFGAFTCEGCKSFFGRSYNNLSSISECKNNGECIINKKNRTACKACRLRKCLMVGMSKSGSRYGRRSNWFKIHCLLQEQQQQQHHHQQSGNLNTGIKTLQKPQPQNSPLSLGLLNPPFTNPLIHHINKTKEELMLLGLDEYKNSASPSVSSPESHNSDSSVEISDARRMPLFHGLIPPTFLPPHSLLFPPGYPPLYPTLLQPTNNNNNRLIRNHNPGAEAFNKRVFLDAVLQSQRSQTPEVGAASPSLESPIQDDPIDLSMKTMSERGSSPAHSDSGNSLTTEQIPGSDSEEESDCNSESGIERIKIARSAPLDLTTKV